MDKNILTVENVSKEFDTKDGSILAIENINFDVKEGEIISIVGTSGCGKSTLLNIIAGLEDKTSGNIIFDSLEPRISYMLQNDALLPWKTVYENAILGLELLKIKDENSVEKTKKMIMEYGLTDFIDKKPVSLSGGMKQRVALIRSLAINPDLLLLDEPFSALDYYTRLTISEDVLNLIKKSGKSAIIITHDIQEALSLGDRVVVLSSRPSVVKNIYDVNLSGLTILEKRKSQVFMDLYEKIWRDLDDEI